MKNIIEYNVIGKFSKKNIFTIYLVIIALISFLITFLYFIELPKNIIVKYQMESYDSTYFLKINTKSIKIVNNYKCMNYVKVYSNNIYDKYVIIPVDSIRYIDNHMFIYCHKCSKIDEIGDLGLTLYYESLINKLIQSVKL
ncbi:hypothetical protein QE390_005100 [Siphonobacter sp. SORGH_AS 1065]|nr:hypothetical protein [Siphonobacter sp. SORGH_AS_1065]